MTIINMLGKETGSQNIILKTEQPNTQAKDSLINNLDITKDQKQLLDYAKELCITSDYALKDFNSGKDNTDSFKQRNNQAKENFKKLFKETYQDTVLKTQQGEELQFDELKFESNSNIYTVIFSSQNEKSFDGSGKKYWFTNGGKDTPIYQQNIRNYDQYTEGMNTQFNFEDESRQTLEEELSYNNHASLFTNYRKNSFENN